MARKPSRVDVVTGGPQPPPICWFELNEVDVRLLAKGLVSTELRAKAVAAVAWLDDDPIGYVDQDFLKLAEAL